MITYKSDDDVARLAGGIVTCSLPRAEWSHAAHFAVALWMLRHRSELAAPEAFRATIMAYNEATGIPNTDTSGYHETITLASLRAAAAFLKCHPRATPLHELVDLLMATPLGRPDWLLLHWTRERLFSPDARRAWLPPDLKPLNY